jgi:hypothetical protein
VASESDLEAVSAGPRRDISEAVRQSRSGALVLAKRQWTCRSSVVPIPKEMTWENVARELVWPLNYFRPDNTLQCAGSLFVVAVNERNPRTAIAITARHTIEHVLREDGQGDSFQDRRPHWLKDEPALFTGREIKPQMSDTFVIPRSGASERQRPGICTP